MKEFQLNLNLQLVGTANSKVLDCKKPPKLEAQTIRASESKSTGGTMCGRFYHDKDKCPEVESKYANKTTSLYVGSAAHSLLVKETGPKSFIPVPERKPSLNLPDSKEAPHKKQFGGKKTWKDNKSKLLYSLSPSLPEIDSSHAFYFSKADKR